MKAYRPQQQGYSSSCMSSEIPGLICVTCRHQQGSRGDGKKNKIRKKHPFSKVLDVVLERGSQICLSAYKMYKQGVDAARRGWGRSTQLCQTHHLLTGPLPRSSHAKRRPRGPQVQLDTGEACRQRARETPTFPCHCAGLQAPSTSLYLVSNNKVHERQQHLPPGN